MVAGSQWFISFMTRAELLLWPRVNQWGSKRRAELISHMDLCTTLFPDEGTFGIWADVMAESQVVWVGQSHRPTLGLRLRPGNGI